MGMTVSAAIIVGLRRDELEDHPDFRDFENGTLDQASPYYDGWQDAIFGVVIAYSQDYSASEITGDIAERISSGKESFQKVTGRDGKVFIMPVVL